MARMTRRRDDHSYVNPLVKYVMFFFNFLFWLFGGLLVGIGLYAFVDKYQEAGDFNVESAFDILLDVSIVMMILGSVIFVVSYAGCIGALRENTCLLNFYSFCLLIFFLAEMAIATLGFVFPHKIADFVKGTLSENLIKNYREDTDLQNLIDFAQKEFHCCGISDAGYQDWNKNEYFNCTENPDDNKGVERCGVPYSCCVNATDVSSGLVNIMCGFGVQTLTPAEASKKIYTTGCITSITRWGEENLYTIGGVALGIALAQLVVIYLGRTLQSQIEAQKASWT